VLSLLPVILTFCLIGLGFGMALGYAVKQGRLRPAGGVVALVLIAFLMPTALMVSRIHEVLDASVGAPEAVRALATGFTVWSVLTLACSLAGVTALALRQPWLAPLVPPGMFTAYYKLVLPLAYEVRERHEALNLDNIPTV